MPIFDIMTVIELIIINNTSKLECDLINAYWMLVEGKFKFNNSELSENYNISIKDILILIKNNSTCKIKFNQCL